ncbi:hypothetical protein CBR_g41598 [Chara braunii]|uniref:CCHC-type domain-containing protein n=1 Tax=Chara braunii TaxID=69332 RepID=A0A388LW95_CHABU|nr:hypothetical protein CBR_g41598 [Chara braunii]|eukprot:GBG86535.1 hypothetical protein CBR_g41598 [Chara braunii]
MGSFLLYVRRHIKPFVRSIVAPAMNWGHCKKLLWNHYTPARQASGRGSLEKRRREPEAEERRTFEQGMPSGTRREDRRKEHRSHRHERAGGSGGPGVPPQPAQREVDCPMPNKEPDVPHEPHVQGQREEQSAQEKEPDRKERAAREQEIKVQLRMKNLAELHERMQQGKEPEEVDDKSGKGTRTQGGGPSPIFRGLGLRDALGSWVTGSGPEGRIGEQVMRADDRATCPTFPEVPQQEVTSKVSIVLSSVPLQEGDKMSQKKIGKCFYCKKGKHRSDDCPKSLKDEANGLTIRESSGVWRDRNGVLVPKTRDGVRAQLHRQLQEVMSDQE